MIKLLKMAYFAISGALMLVTAVSLPVANFGGFLFCCWLFSIVWMPVSLVAIVALEQKMVLHISFSLFVSIAVCVVCGFNSLAMFFAKNWYVYLIEHQLVAMAVSAPMLILAAACFYEIYRASRTPTLAK